MPIQFPRLWFTPTRPASSPVYVVNMRLPHRGSSSLRPIVEEGIAANINLSVIEGRNVLIKPNFGGPGSVEHRYAMTSLDLIAQISDIFNAYGAKRVTLCDNPAGYVENAEDFFNAMQINTLSQNHGFTFVNGRNIDGTAMRGLLRQSDIIINTALPKTHNQAGGVTLCLKNLGMGLIPQEVRDGLHQNNHANLQSGIAQNNRNIRSDKIVLDIIDMRYGMERMGPHFGSGVEPGIMLFSGDPVAIDSAAARFMGLNPEYIGHISASQDLRLGTMNARLEGDSDGIDIRRFIPSIDYEFTTLEGWERLAVYNFEDSPQTPLVEMRFYDLVLDAHRGYRYNLRNTISQTFDRQPGQQSWQATESIRSQLNDGCLRNNPWGIVI